MAQTEQSSADRVVCPASKDPAVRYFIIAAGLIGIGLWGLSDQRSAPAAWDMKHINDAANYVINNILPYLLMPAGLVLAALTAASLKRVLVADGEGIGYQGKEIIRWEQVTQLDATRIKKGYLLVRRGDDALTLDSWKLLNFKELVAHVEKHVPADKIVR